MKKVALFTTFFEASSGYSLIAVAETQIRMLLGGGYEPTVLVQDRFGTDEDEKPVALPFQEIPPPSVWNSHMIDLRSVIPAMRLDPGVAKDFEARAESVLLALRENLAHIDVCITHDIILQNWYKEHNVAMRRYAKERPDLLWLHWIHSCPSTAETANYPDSSRHTPPPGYIVYPNDSDRALVVQAYNMAGQEHRVKVCRAGHAIDPLMVWRYDGLTKDLVRKSGLLDADISIVYPARLDRGKKPEKIIRIMAGIKRIGLEPRLLICDWQSMGERFMKYKLELEELATSLGIGNCVHFTSKLDDRCSQGVPRHVVVELTDLSNVYIHPSAVETYSITIHEAALRAKLLVLNHDFPAMRELFGQTAIYMDFGSDRVGRKYKSDEHEQMFWNGEALRLIAEFQQNRSLVAQTVARREWSPKALWKEFQPLFHLEPVGE